MGTHKRVLWMDIDRFIMDELKASGAGVFRSYKRLSKRAKAQGQGIQLLSLFAGLFHPDFQWGSKTRKTQNGANVRATYIFAAIYAKILINKHFLSPIK
jgi:hypothetical protein